MTKRTMALACAALTAAVLLTACGQDTPDQAEQAELPKVGVVELQSQRVELFAELPGRIAAYQMAEVRPQITGIVEKRFFDQGARVEAGQTLYRIDPKPYRAAYEQAKADLARARAAVGAVRQQEERYAALVEENAVSQQEYDDVKATLDQRLAEVQVAQAALESARINLNYTEVKAPIQGRISPTFVTVGALVTANQTQALARITRLDPIYVDIQRSVAELARLRQALEQGRLKEVKPGQARVSLLLDGGQTYPHPGRLEVTDVTVNEGTGSVTLRARFPNPEHILLPGMYVRTRLSEGVRENAILAPQQGVSHDRQGQATALVVNRQNKVVRRQIEVGRALDSFWLVDSGLAAGDRLIVSGLQEVEPGAEVEPVPADIPNMPADTARQSGERGGNQDTPETGGQPETAPAGSGQADG